MVEITWKNEHVGKRWIGGIEKTGWRPYQGAEFALDKDGGFWFRETLQDPIRYKLWTTFESEHRKNIFVRMYLYLDETGVITDIDMDAQKGLGECSQTPANVNQKETEDIRKFLAEFFKD
jgi:hypothetical protein